MQPSPTAFRPSRRRSPAACIILAACSLAGGCRARATDESPEEASTEGIRAVILPSPGDAQLALLPTPVQLAVQVNPQAVLADPTLSLAVRAFLVGIADDAAATESCLERLARDGVVVTYAWIGGAADGWVLLADAALDADALAACVRAFGVAPPPGGFVDPEVGAAARLGATGELTLVRLAPDRRALGLAPTIEAVRAAAVDPSRTGVPEGAPDDILPRLRQGDVKFYADLDQLAALGAADLPLIDDADRVGLLLRLEAMRADSVLLVHARGGQAVPRLAETLDGALSALRRSILDEPGVSEASVYSVFDGAKVERLEQVLRVRLVMDRPTLASLITFLAHRALPRFGGPRRPPPPVPSPPALPARDGGTAPPDAD
ncbi:MAG: hypothetical protein HY905_02210 [Deltaproteobacteria bacterium]|nr:hypothetical protein [Deltaproteobacteria bacterium]